MSANVVTKFGWTPMKIVEKLKTAPAYGPVLRKFQSAIIMQFMAERQKVTACMIMISCVKLGGIR